MGYALVGLCAVHCRTLAARYGRGAGLRQEMIRGITRRTDESAPTVLFLQQRRPPPSRPRPPRDGPQALEIKGFRDSRRESTRFSPSEPPAPASAVIRAHFPACESALRATGGRFCRIDPPIRPPCRFAQAGVPRRRPAPPRSISRPDGAPPSPAESRQRGALAACGLSRCRGPVSQLPDPRQDPPAALPAQPQPVRYPRTSRTAGRLDVPIAAASLADRLRRIRPQPRSLRPFAALSRLRHRGPRAAAMLQAPQPPLSDRLRRLRPSPAWPLALRRAARPVRQLPLPRQAPARRLACKAAAGPTPPASRPPPPKHHSRRCPTSPASRIASAHAPADSQTAAAPAPPRRPSTRAAKFGIIAGGTAPSRRARHRARDDATARQRGDAMARQRGGGTAACAARPAAPAPGRRRAPPQPGSSQTSRGETP